MNRGSLGKEIEAYFLPEQMWNQFYAVLKLKYSLTCQYAENVISESSSAPACSLRRLFARFFSDFCCFLLKSVFLLRNLFYFGSVKSGISRETWGHGLMTKLRHIVQVPRVVFCWLRPIPECAHAAELSRGSYLSGRDSCTPETVTWESQRPGSGAAGRANTGEDSRESITGFPTSPQCDVFVVPLYLVGVHVGRVCTQQPVS